MQPFYLWPTPHCDVAKSLLDVIQVEDVKRGNLLVCVSVSVCLSESVLCIKSFSIYCMRCAHGIDCYSHSNIICLFWWGYGNYVTGTTSGADGHEIILWL